MKSWPSAPTIKLIRKLYYKKMKSNSDTAKYKKECNQVRDASRSDD